MAPPRDPMILARQITQASRDGNELAALTLASEALGEHPSHPFVLRAASEVHLNLRDYDKAVELAEAAVGAAPDDPGGYLQLCSCYTSAENEEKAVQAAKRAAELMPNSPLVLSHVATMLSRLDDNDAALTLYTEALRLNPGNAQDHYNLAMVRQYLGDLEGAEKSCDRALSTNSRLYETHFVRSRLRKQSSERNHVTELEQARLVTGKAPLEQAMVCYALAKEYEDLGEYEKSFAALEEGANTYRKSIDYDLKLDTDHMDNVREAFTADVCGDTSHGYDSDAPVFVLGLPRTGTTLVERIFASHSQVISAGELPNLLTQLKRKTRKRNPNQSADEMVLDALALPPAELGEAYVRSVPAKYKVAQKFVDKLPANFLYLGFIRRSLPNAMIVELKRHPMDACYAMYKMLFNQIYPGSYDLNDLARYYIHYRKLMDHWHEHFPGQIKTVSYEDVVADQERQSRFLMDAAGLPWEESVLEFHKTKSASATASAAQVRSPVYSSSVQLWRRYETQLAPLAEQLDAAGIDIS